MTPVLLLIGAMAAAFAAGYMRGRHVGRETGRGQALEAEMCRQHLAHASDIFDELEGRFHRAMAQTRLWRDRARRPKHVRTTRARGDGIQLSGWPSHGPAQILKSTLPFEDPR